MASTSSWIQRLLRSIEQNAKQPQFFQLSTVNSADGSPRCRTVVCRSIVADGDKDGHLLVCTSTESDKWAELAKDQRFEICWYFAESREQFRLRGKRTRMLLMSNNDPEARQVWDSMSLTAKDMFLKASDPNSCNEPVAFGVLAFHPDAVQLLELTSGAITAWDCV